MTDITAPGGLVSTKMHDNGDGTFSPIIYIVGGSLTATPPANSPFNLNQIAGNAASTNSGAADIGTQRNVLSNDFLSTASIAQASVEDATLNATPTTTTIDLVPSVDMKRYPAATLHVTGINTGTWQVQWSNDNVNWITYNSIYAPSSLPTSTFTAAGIYQIVRMARYMRIRCSVTGTGATTGVVEYWTVAPPKIQEVISATMNGVWTMVPAAGSGGWTPSLQNALSNTVKAVKSSAAAQLGGYEFYNPNASVAYVQVFDVATSGGVTLGTTTPKLSIPIPASTARDVDISGNGISFSNGIQIAATTTATGLTALGTALDGNMWFK